MSDRDVEPTTHGEDLELVRRSLAREPDAVEELSRRLDCVYAIVTSLSKQVGANLAPGDREDVSQDALLSILRRLDSYEGRAKLETWAYRHCFNHLMNHLRRRKRYRKVMQPFHDGMEPVLPSGGDAVDLERLERALQELSPPRSEIIRKRHFEQLDFSEIGASLGMAVNTIRSHYYRGIAWLRGRLQQLDRKAPLEPRRS